MDSFKIQIDEDIKLIQREYGNIDPRLTKVEFAFNYWVLSRIYSLDEEIISPNITEYNDKNIDCYVWYEDIKELHIIQNKYYELDTVVNRNDVSDFLTTPLSVLNRGQYSRNPELQRIFDRIKSDNEYKIYLSFFVTNEYHSPDIDGLFDKDYSLPGIEASVYAKYYDLSDIKSLYYGDRFTNKVNFYTIMPTRQKATSLDVRPDNYDMPWMIDLRYVMINVAELYRIYKEAAKKNYVLFEENIREYLGTQGINNGIIKTLKDKNDRENFFYYNNGITIICEYCETLGVDKLPAEYKKRKYNYGFKLTNPQIVNGCQTINSIAEVLSHYDEKSVYSEFEKVYVLVKIFVFDETTKRSKAGLDKNIVRFTNSQNAISDKAFASKKNYFLNIQSEFVKRGYLLLVKPSDKAKYTSEYNDPVEFKKLQNKAKSFDERLDLHSSKLSDYMIPLEKLLKVLLAFRENGYIAFTRGSSVLKPNSPMYKDFSLNIETWCTIDNMLLLYLMHYKAEKEKKASESKRFPIPYYVMSFIGASCKDKAPSELKKQLDFLFQSKENFLPIYNFYKELTTAYAENVRDYYNMDYNIMIKQEMFPSIFDNCFRNSLRFYPDKERIKTFVEYGKYINY